MTPQAFRANMRGVPGREIPVVDGQHQNRTGQPSERGGTDRCGKFRGKPGLYRGAVHFRNRLLACKSEVFALLPREAPGIFGAVPLTRKARPRKSFCSVVVQVSRSVYVMVRSCERLIRTRVLPRERRTDRSGIAAESGAGIINDAVSVKCRRQAVVSTADMEASSCSFISCGRTDGNSTPSGISGFMVRW